MNEQKIVEMYTQQKMSTYEIAQNLNTYPNKIRRLLIKNGVRMNTKSEAQKNALEKGTSKIPTVGKERTHEEKLKISKTLTKRWKSMSQEEYESRVECSKNRWANMSEEKKLNMSQAAIKAIQKAGKEGSKLEKMLYEQLTEFGYTVEVHKKNLIPNENLEIDMYLPTLKAIIEIDGPSHFLPIWGEEKLRKQIKADSNKTGLILSKGFFILRIKNLTDSLSLFKKDNLTKRVLSVLSSIESKFPAKSNRYLEIEV